MFGDGRFMEFDVFAGDFYDLMNGRLPQRCFSARRNKKAIWIWKGGVWERETYNVCIVSHDHRGSEA